MVPVPVDEHGVDLFRGKALKPQGMKQPPGVVPLNVGVGRVLVIEAGIHQQFPLTGRSKLALVVESHRCNPPMLCLAFRQKVLPRARPFPGPRQRPDSGADRGKARSHSFAEAGKLGRLHRTGEIHGRPRQALYTERVNPS